VTFRETVRLGGFLLAVACAPRQASLGLPASPDDRVYEERELDRPVSPIVIPAPEYPKYMQGVGAPGRVWLEYIVGADGRAEASSIRVVQASQPAFGESAVKAIREALFHPGVKGGRNVRVRVKQLITFQVSSH
jgi:TonB family protein